MADLGSVAIDGSPEVGGIQMAQVVAAIGPLTMTVSGVVKDDTDANTSRVVRIYTRADGRLVGETTSNATTGAYGLPCPDEEVQRIVLDDSAGTLYNDLVDR